MVRVKGCTTQAVRSYGVRDALRSDETNSFEDVSILPAALSSLPAFGIGKKFHSKFA